MRTVTIGVDLSKQVFSACTLDDGGRVVGRQELRREAFVVWLAQVPAGTAVAMEACSGAHHWARRCLERGLQPRLMAAQFVKPFRKSQAAKNDRNDAEAIATAARQGNMRFVPVKTVEQQARLSEHRIRELATRLPFGKVLVAIANKHARQAWAMLARGEDYDPEAWLRHPMVQRPASKRRAARTP